MSDYDGYRLKHNGDGDVEVVFQITVPCDDLLKEKAFITAFEKLAEMIEDAQDVYGRQP